MRILYISYDGMTDPLGQSQVLPYLAGLSKKGHEISIVSAEKKNNYALNYEYVSSFVNEHKLSWNPLSYTAKPAVISTLFDVLKMYVLARKLHKKNNFQIVHCRSYIAALIGLKLKRKHGLSFVFDMRGFWADERMEGGIWSAKSVLFRFIYKYFKNKEKAFISNADHIVCLTHQGKAIVRQWQKSLPEVPVSVIPCCVDTDLFSVQNIDKNKLLVLQSMLNIKVEDKVLGYLGSLGTWYMADEMMLFFKSLSAYDNTFKFLFVTYEPPELIYNLARKFDVDCDKIIIYKAKRQEVPILISLMDVSIFFIKPVFSKKASSPTKQAEVLSMGVPVICNTGVGDVDEIVNNNFGIVVNDFKFSDFQSVIKDMNKILNIPPNQISKVAETHFSLNKGIEMYDNIYKSLNDK